MPVKQLTEIARTGKTTGISHVSHGHRRVSKHSTSLFKAIVVQVLHGRYRQISLKRDVHFVLQQFPALEMSLSSSLPG